jgi:16S rRNA (guanine(966)-N(2))-methyltransferase RsmD
VAARPKSGGAGRVIAGSARGLALLAPGEGTRPLGDRVKQTLFAILEPQIRRGAFLDLFAGSGAAGIEALSRGAERAVFVDRDADAIRTIESNLAATRLRDRAIVIRGDVLKWLRGEGRRAGPFAGVLVDPPYERVDLLAATLAEVASAGPATALALEGILSADGTVVAKHFLKTEVPAEIGLLRSVRERRFGETTLTFLRWAPAGADSEVEEDR